ncbi:MAG: hypothetical protein PUI48_02100 [Oscillospiraceae bacterium]|nr:hypothetical protein [Oscillospiraceae bacterium]MDY6209098.1 hypothetical protein [Oscillospiraceae bacterium]
MKGLIYRELYLTRKTYISAFFTYLLITLLLVLINLSISFGNLRDIISAENGESTKNTLFYISVIIPSVVLYLMSAANFELVDKDITTKWLTYQYTIPVSTKKCAFVKILIITVSIITAFALSMVNMALFCALYGRSPDRILMGVLTFLMPLTSLGAIALVSLTLLFRNSTAAAIAIFASAFAVAYPFMMKLIIASENDLDSFSLMPYLNRLADFTCLYPFIAIAVLAIGQLLLTAALGRRDNYRIKEKKEAAEK